MLYVFQRKKKKPSKKIFLKKNAMWMVFLSVDVHIGLLGCLLCTCEI